MCSELRIIYIIRTPHEGCNSGIFYCVCNSRFETFKPTLNSAGSVIERILNLLAERELVTPIMIVSV